MGIDAFTDYFKKAVVLCIVCIYFILTFTYLRYTCEKPSFYLEYVDNTSTELGIEVQVEQVRLVLLLFQNLTALN